MDTWAGRCYAQRVKLAVLVLVLLLAAAVHAEDRDDEPTGLSQRLRTIDESAEFEADHPERLGADPADAAEEEPEDPTAAPADEGEPAAAPARSRRPSTRARSDAPTAAHGGSAPSAPAVPPAPALGSTLQSPIGTSPLAPSPSSADDDY